MAVIPTRAKSSLKMENHFKTDTHSSPGSSRPDLTPVRKSSRIQNGTPKEEKLSNMFSCTPVKGEEDNNDDQDNTDEDSESRQTIKENRNTYQTPAFDERKGNMVARWL